MNEDNVLDNFNKEWKGFKGYTKLGNYTQRSIVNAVKEILNEINLPSDAKIIDMGCGLCKMLHAFRDWGYANSVGIDFSQESIKKCEEKGFKKNKDIFLLDATNTNYKEKDFTLVFEEGVLEHYKDRTYLPFIKEMVRLSGQYILIAQPDHFSLYGMVTQLFYIFAQRGVKEYTYRIGDFIKAFEAENFKVKYIKKTAFKDWQIILFERSE
ncbi:MAG: class I SAM-dependent methyltransferase [Caldisericales bacterium]|nr:class I SAM-dependent methyltransferase [Caldisericales bacterium]